ncbi:MAG: hypothetical protein HN341_01480 [Verrucomicrobia bacterium]|nr:hypothetical protein [Verrucomicrobiota bacterium]
MTPFRHALVLVAMGAAVAQAKPADLAVYPHARHLVPESRSAEALGSFVLDSEVFAGTRNDFANMRIVDDAGTEIPFLVRARTEAVTSTSDRVIPTRVEAIRELPGNRIEIEVSRRGPAIVSQEIDLSTRLRNFEKLVTIHGTTDGNSWSEIASGVPVVDYSRFIDYQKTRIPFTSGAYKRLRLVVSDVTLERELPFKKKVREALHGKIKSEFVETSFKTEDFRIDSFRLLGRRTRETGQRAVTRKTPIGDFQVAQDGSKTIITFAANREPVGGIRIETPSVNFSRPMLVEGRSGGGGGGFKSLFRGVYSHIAIGDVQRDRCTLSLAIPSRCVEWRITIDNRDSPALDISGVWVEEQVNEAVFLGTQTANYRVVYGGSSTVLPRYDVATILSTVGRSPVAAYRLGESLENLAYERSCWRLQVGGKAVLSGAILMMVLALGWGIAVAAKKVDVA